MPTPAQWQKLDVAIELYDEQENHADAKERTPTNIAARALVVVRCAREVMRAQHAEKTAGVFMIDLCGQAFCTNEAVFSFVWPGRARTLICAEHSRKLEALADAVGLTYASLDVLAVKP